MKAPSSALLDHPRSLDARTAVNLRYEAADSHLIYSGRWIINNTGAYSSYRLGDSEDASATLYFSGQSHHLRVSSHLLTLHPVGSSVAVFAPGLPSEVASENAELPLVTYTIDGREDLCTISQHLSHGTPSSMAMVDCHVPSSPGPHVFYLGTRSPSFTFSYVEIYSLPSSSPTSPPSPNYQLVPQSAFRHHPDEGSRFLRRRGGPDGSPPNSQPQQPPPTSSPNNPGQSTPSDHSQLSGTICFGSSPQASCTPPFTPSSISIPSTSSSSPVRTASHTATSSVNNTTTTVYLSGTMSSQSWPPPSNPPDHWPPPPWPSSSQAASSVGDMSASRHLSPGDIAGIVVGSVGGVLLLALFLWLLRRGTFGSGTLFGFRYGDARYPGWKAGGTGAEMRQRDVEGYAVGESFTHVSLSWMGTLVGGSHLVHEATRLQARHPSLSHVSYTSNPTAHRV